MRLKSREQRPRRLQVGAFTVTAALAGAVVLAGPAAPSASAADGNATPTDSWKLVSPGSAGTADTLDGGRDGDWAVPYRANATKSAKTVLPTPTGDVSVDAAFVSNAGGIAGTNMFAGSTSLGIDPGAKASNYLGAPNPTSTPALLVYSSASVVPACGGNRNTQAKLNFGGVCKNTGRVTFTFSKPVSDVIIDFGGIGGYAQVTQRQTEANGTVDQNSRGSTINTIWNLQNTDATLSAAPGAQNLQVVGGKTVKVVKPNAAAACNGTNHIHGGTTYRSPDFASNGCGSVVAKGTYTKLDFLLDSAVYPYKTNFPRATHNTGSSFFGSSYDGNNDGVNGLNITPTENVLISDGWKAQDQTLSDAHVVALRLPAAEPGGVGEIGDKVWADEDKDGVQDEGEGGVAGVKVNLLDSNREPVIGADGKPITTTTDENGNYRFTDLPLGSYIVEFVDDPADEYEFSPRDAGSDALDSDADPFSGRTAVVELTADSPSNRTIDAGLVTPPGPAVSVMDPMVGGGIAVLLAAGGGLWLLRRRSVV